MKLKELIKILSKDDVDRLYKEHNSLRRIANIYSVSPQTIARLMDHYGIKRNDNNIGNKKHFFNEDYFKIIDTEEKSYWLGFIMADGCIYKGDNDTFRLQINLKYEDISHLNKFQKAISSDYCIQRKEINNSTICILKINSTKMCKDLINLGVVERKSFACKFPNINVSLYRHFIRGYFDGDGCISLTLNTRLRKEFSIVGGGEIINSFSEILNLKLYTIPKKKYLKCVKTSNTNEILSIYEYLYKDSKIFLQRKKKVYDILIYILRSPLME